ncbi:MAG: 16S rRNA (cytosine(967)-C(5))-methyltransferase RsmB [Ruminococcaceae bacterium]|nr:16S rRNA (cytosine(967)-C(5))-methyltransferase RsmB [Oscillospiraceae bacterium]
MNVRELAYLSLEKCASAGRYSNIETDTVIKRNEMQDRDRALYTELVYGTLEKEINIDHVISLFSRIPVEKIEKKLLVLLRMGIYQILYLSRIPDSAACNETVELCKKYSHKGADKFVNAVLRSVVRNKDNIEYPDEKKDIYAYLSAKYSVPKWIAEKWDADYGRERTVKILETLEERPPLCLRTNTLKTSRDELFKKLMAEGYECKKTELSENGIKIYGNVSVPSLSAIEEGLAIVQDEASQLCAEAVDAKAGETVIDTCACPGGKSFSMSISMGNEGKLYSFDLHENKLSLVKNGALRLGINIIETGRADGREGKEELFGKADRVLCDVPCSGLGVIAKKPDLRHKTKEDTERLPEIQYAILNTSSAYVKKGGRLVYSTCTLNKDENEKNAERFLKEHGDFIYDSFGHKTFFPYENGTDGFFVAVFKRLEEK